MEMKRRGFTLMEIIIYTALGALALGAILTMFFITKSAQRQSYTSSLVSGRVYTALRYLRKDLQETALASIKVYPDSVNTSDPPGMSLASAYLGDGNPQLTISSFGSPQWERSVFYTLKPRTAKTGTLVRWTKNYDNIDLLPHLDLTPTSSINSATERTLLEDVLLPSITVDNVGDGGSFSTGDQGGFEVSFVRRQGGEAGDETLTPNRPSTGNPANNTRLVQVELKILRDEKRSKPSLFTLKLRVMPRY